MTRMFVGSNSCLKSSVAPLARPTELGLKKNFDLFVVFVHGTLLLYWETGDEK